MAKLSHAQSEMKNEFIHFHYYTIHKELEEMKFRLKAAQQNTPSKWKQITGKYSTHLQATAASSFVSAATLLFTVLLALKLDGHTYPLSVVCLPIWAILLLMLGLLVHMGWKKKTARIPAGLAALIPIILAVWVSLVLLKLEGLVKDSWFSVFGPLWVLSIVGVFLSFISVAVTWMDFIKQNQRLITHGVNLGWTVILFSVVTLFTIFEVLLVSKLEHLFASSFTWFRVFSPLWVALGGFAVSMSVVAAGGALRSPKCAPVANKCCFSVSRVCWCAKGDISAGSLVSIVVGLVMCFLVFLAQNAEAVDILYSYVTVFSPLIIVEVLALLFSLTLPLYM